MNDRYIKNNKPIRAQIVQDIISRTLKKSDLETLLKNDIIKENLSFGPFLEKKDKTEWTRDYLEGLFYHTGTKYFSKDFLFYLEEVAEYVVNTEPQKNKQNNVYKYIYIVIIIVVFIVFLKSCISSMD